MDMLMGTNMFQVTNMALARGFWYAVAATVGIFLFIRLLRLVDTAVRLRSRAALALPFPTKPRHAVLQLWATLTAIGREVSYPQLSLPSRVGAAWGWLTPPPLGRLVLLFGYWALVVAMMTAGAIVDDVSFHERIGFRNAWVTIAQFPLLYLLAGKVSVLGALVGMSHERLNWLHRWVARTMFVTASVHGWHFYTEYSSAGLASEFFAVEPMGYYGIAAWALLLWSCLSGLAPLRHACYELFVLQHIATAVVLLWVVYRHVPGYAQYHVWFAIGALCFDRAARLLLLVWQNLKLRRPSSASRCSGRGQRVGHEAYLRAVGDDITVVTIKDVHFRWRAGQHLYLWMPALAPLEQHPYTIACAHQLPDTCICNSIQLVVRQHGGFSRRLHARAKALQDAAAQNDAGAACGCGGTDDAFTVFVTGPFGTPPRWDIYETLVLISASTGASFTLPILESVLQAARDGQQTICTKRVDVLLTATKGDQIDYYVQRLHELLAIAKDVGLELTVHIAVTRERDTGAAVAGRGGAAVAAAATTRVQSTATGTEGLGEKEARTDVEKMAPMTAATTASTTSATTSTLPHPRASRSSSNSSRRAPSASTASSSHLCLLRSSTRPDIEAWIRRPVEATGGETSVVVCGGRSLVARTRNCVALLSDERAVHKGTGAQGIHLHVEEYAF